ncbi:rhamnan synthesis F family protein [Campylobacter sp. P0109]|uniref:rhamnan synthesis F family protein n=1 Tax=Campylobacter sp. P0109 TaxID=1895606 RepID=UPI000A32CB00|nr:rhamnan synthesis F family protein [Campylobacter sp. P0109]
MSKTILVHCHIYYPNFYEELKECILNISPHKFDLFVTMVAENSEIITDIKTTFPSAKIEIVENHGYDIGPFVHVLNQVNLDDYSYVVKIHTKRDMKKGSLLNYFDVSGSKWRNYALDFISTVNKFKYCIQEFEKNNDLGMVSNYRLICNKELYDKNAKKEAIQLLKKLSFQNTDYGFVAGTMFIVRAKLLNPLLKLQLNIKDFDVPDSEHSSSLAHTIERLLGCLVLAEKKKIADVLTPRQYLISIQKILLRLKFFAFQKKISSRGVLTVKICKIPVYSKRTDKCQFM